MTENNNRKSGLPGLTAMSINNNNEDDANIFWLTKVDLISLYFTVESQQLSLFLYFSQILVLSYLGSWNNIQRQNWSLIYIF